MTKTKAYIAIDLKSFYASVECKERNRDPLTTNLVVADQKPDGEDDLPCGISIAEKLWNTRQTTFV